MTTQRFSARALILIAIPVVAIAVNSGIGLRHARTGDAWSVSELAQGCDEFDLGLAKRVVPGAVEPPRYAPGTAPPCIYRDPASGSAVSLSYRSRADVGFDLARALAERRSAAAPAGGATTPVAGLYAGAWARTSLTAEGKAKTRVEWADPDSLWSLEVTRLPTGGVAHEIEDLAAVARETRARLDRAEER